MTATPDVAVYWDASAVRHSSGPDVVEDVLTEAGRQLALMHTLRVDGSGWITRTPGIDKLRGDYRDHRDWFDREIGPLCEKALATNVFDERERDAIARVLARPEDALRGPSALVHGDMDPGHIFRFRGRFSGFIDFGEIHGTPAEYDLATFIRFRGPRRVVPFLRGYGTFDVAIRRGIDGWAQGLAL